MLTNISVIVPVYKVEAYINRCIDSIPNQTCTDFELILIDDGSPDCCAARCDEYLLADSRITVIHQPNGGLSSARNSALDIASGEYVTFIDSDDFVTDDYLEYLFKLLISNSADVSVCGFVSFEDGTEPVMDTSEVPKPIVMSGREACFSLYKMEGIVWVAACGKLYCRQLFVDLRFPAGRIHEDDATVPIALYNANTVVISKKKNVYVSPKTRQYYRQAIFCKKI